MKLAIFDFDGTITTRDSFTDFIFFCFGTCRTILGIIILSPHIILYALGLEPNWKAKSFVLKYFFKGLNKENLNKYARNYISQKLPDLIRPMALEKLKWHQKEGHRIVIVSASFECYLSIWCESLGLDIIATKMEIKNEILTGKLATKNCYGEEKILRLKEKHNLADFDYIYAYGDTKGDLPLRTIANEFHYKPFRKPRAA